MNEGQLPTPPDDRRADLNGRLRQAFIEGAEADSQGRLGRGLTAAELERVLRHYPGDFGTTPGTERRMQPDGADLDPLTGLLAGPNSTRSPQRRPSPTSTSATSVASTTPTDTTGPLSVWCRAGDVHAERRFSVGRARTRHLAERSSEGRRSSPGRLPGVVRASTIG